MINTILSILVSLGSRTPVITKDDLREIIWASHKIGYEQAIEDEMYKNDDLILVRLRTVDAIEEKL